MGTIPTTKAQARRTIDEFLGSSNQLQQRAVWRRLVEGKLSPDPLVSTMQSSDVDVLRANNYPLYHGLLVDVPKMQVHDYL